MLDIREIFGVLLKSEQLWASVIINWRKIDISEADLIQSASFRVFLIEFGRLSSFVVFQLSQIKVLDFNLLNIKVLTHNISLLNVARDLVMNKLITGFIIMD